MINVILFRPEKPQNTGNIMRTCVAIHACLHIIGPISFSIDDKDLKRAGMDYIKDLKMHYYKDIQEFYLKHPKEEIVYITRYSNKVYSNYNFSDQIKDYYVMFGRESTGIPYDILKENFEYTLRIPMVPEARSLNLSNCVSIICYEILRQQNFTDLSTCEALKGEEFIKNQ